MTKPICLLAYDGMELLDFAGPQSAIHEAAQVCSNSYELKVIGFSKTPIQCEAGLQIVPAIDIGEVKQCHTLIIPGGRGARKIALPSIQMKQLKSLMSRCERLVTICTGVYLAAKIGLPDNIRVATHWAFVADLKKRYSSLAVDCESIFVQDGKYWSSAGITSGIDLTLRLIENDCGPAVAHHVAKHLVVYSKRSGSQKQYSDLLDIQAPKSDRIATISNWVKEHVNETITVKQLSDVACLSERQCHRLFLKETDMTPAQFVEKYRMQLASDLLATTEKEVKSIAFALGFKTYNGFARAFKKSFAVSPLKYRQSFFT
ncbi:GlxA family transcriptional regulator [Alteromonas mediterranea]|uniref:GlxA family transcriptional regulator n=1 Tax=Alteromonas mediterranea TaxID=314275 RepID=UPI002FE3A2D3